MTKRKRKRRRRQPRQPRRSTRQALEAPEYSEQVADLLNDGLAAMQAGDDEQAERLYRQALQLESGAREAYNNLGAIYHNRGEAARAREMFEAALEIDMA